MRTHARMVGSRAAAGAARGGRTRRVGCAMERRKRKGRFRSVVKTVVAVQRFAGSEEGVGGRRRAAQQASYEAGPSCAATPFEIVGTQVLAACTSGDVATLRKLVSQIPLAADFEDRAGRTPLSVAATVGRAEVCRALLELGATLERPNKKEGKTPLAVCSWSGSETGVRTLAAVGADLSTPLQINGELVPPVALCPDAGMVAVFEELNHGSAQPVLIRQKSFRRAATVIIAAERFRRGGGPEFGRLSRIDECAVEDSRSSLEWDESTRRKMQAAADAAAANEVAGNRVEGELDKSPEPIVDRASGRATKSKQARIEESARQRDRRLETQKWKRGCCGSRPAQDGDAAAA